MGRWVCSLLLLLQIFGAGSDGYVWTWMLGSPYPPEDLDNVDNHPRQVHRVRHGGQNHTNVLNGLLLTRLQGANEENCSDKTCGRGRFCDVHYQFCRPRKGGGEPCRRDGHCHKEYDCMFGKCLKKIPLGLAGSRCRRDNDCGGDQCCARQHGEFVCKMKIQAGAKCYVPEGGLAYTLNSICPCQEGLVCRETQVSSESLASDEQRYWTDLYQMRCQPVT